MIDDWIAGYIDALNDVKETIGDAGLIAGDYVRAKLDECIRDMRARLTTWGHDD